MEAQVETVGRVRVLGRFVDVTVERWIGCEGRPLYTPKCSALGLGGRDFARRHAAIRYAERVANAPMIASGVA